MDAALEVGHGVFDWVLEASWQAVFLAVLVLGVQWLFRKRLTAEWRYGLWLLVILRLLIPAFPESAFSVYNLRHFAGVPHSQSQGDERFNRAASRRSTEREQSVSGTQETEIAVPNPSPGSVDETPVTAKASSEPRMATGRSQKEAKPLYSSVSLYDVVMGLWLAGATALALSAFIGNFRLVVLLRRNGRTVTTPQVLSSLKACGVRMGVRPPELVETDLVQSPAIYGLWRRRLLLPRHVVREFSPGELEYVFLHELAHLKRRDTWVDAAMVASQVLHWFNPAVWLTVSQMRLERELACDRMALARSNESERVSYGETMIKVLERFRRAPSVSGVVGVLEDKNQLRRRIELIASYRPKRKWPILGGLAIVFLAAIALTDAESSRQTIQLEDGSKVAIAKITSGTDQRFVYGSSWEKFTYSVVPGYFLDTEQGDEEELTYRRFRDSHGRKAIFRPKESSVVLWIEHHGFDGSISSYESQYQLVTIGPDGRPFSTARVHPIDKLEGRAILAWELERFPRRGEKIECRLQTQRGTEWEEVTRFSVPNPKGKDYPQWEPNPLPITKSRDGLTVKFTDLKTGDHPSYSYPGMNETSYETRFGVEVYVNGEPTTAWNPNSFSAIDATGNRHPEDWNGLVQDNVNNEQGRIVAGLIGPSEPWKIRISFRAGPGASVPEESLIRISDFRLSTNDTSVVTREVGDVSLELRTELNKYTQSPLRVQSTPPAEKSGYQVTIVSAQNESGDTVPLTRKVHNTEKGLTWFEPEEGELTMPQRLDLTVAVYRAPEFEFVAQPDWFSQKWTEPTKEDISELIDGLNSENRTTRWNAAEALKDLGALAEEAVPALTKALDDSSPKVRRSAANALRDIGRPAKQATDELLELLEDPSKYIPGTAARALGEIGAQPETVVPRLVKALESKDWHLRQYAARALGDYAPKSRPIVSKLLGLLNDSDTWVREEAIKALGKMPANPERVVPKLIPLLKSDDGDIRSNTREAIVALGVPTEKSLEGITEIARSRSNLDTRKAAIRTLGMLGQGARPTIPDLEAIAKEASPEIALAAAVSLFEIDGSNQTAETTFLEMMRHSDVEVQRSAIARLSRVEIKSEHLLEALVKAVEHSNVRVGARAVQTIGRANISSRKAVRRLVNALDDENERVRNNAARALAIVGAKGKLAEKALPKLERMIKKADPRDRYEIALAMWRVDSSRETFERVADILRNRDDKGAIIYILKQIGPPARPFVPLLEDFKRQTGAPWDRKRITETLAKIKTGGD